MPLKVETKQEEPPRRRFSSKIKAEQPRPRFLLPFFNVPAEIWAVELRCQRAEGSGCSCLVPTPEGVLTC